MKFVSSSCYPYGLVFFWVMLGVSKFIKLIILNNDPIQWEFRDVGKV